MMVSDLKIQLISDQEMAENFFRKIDEKFSGRVINNKINILICEIIISGDYIEFLLNSELFRVYSDMIRKVLPGIKRILEDQRILKIGWQLVKDSEYFYKIFDIKISPIQDIYSLFILEGFDPMDSRNDFTRKFGVERNTLRTIGDIRLNEIAAMMNYLETKFSFKNEFEKSSENNKLPNGSQLIKLQPTCKISPISPIIQESDNYGRQLYKPRLPNIQTYNSDLNKRIQAFPERSEGIDNKNLQTPNLKHSDVSLYHWIKKYLSKTDFRDRNKLVNQIANSYSNYSKISSMDDRKIKAIEKLENLVNSGHLESNKLGNIRLV